MKRSIYLLFLLLIITACGTKKQTARPLQPGEELVGNWRTGGTFYAGSLITGTTTFIFNQDKTFVALEEAKGMPAIKETGSWVTLGDTLKIKYDKPERKRADVITFEDRNGGSRDILKPTEADSNGYITWNYKIAGNKLILENKTALYSGPSTLEKVLD